MTAIGKDFNGGQVPFKTIDDNGEIIPVFSLDSMALNLFTRILNMLKSPVGFDRALNRSRVTAAIESGTITTVTTVTTVSNIGAIGGHQAQLEVLAMSRASWALNHRSRIS